MTEYEFSQINQSAFTLLVDTREQDTVEFRRRLKAMPCGHERQKLDFGDYSMKAVLPDGTVFHLERKIAVERKMSLDEIAGNLTRGRARFTREFDRCKAAGGKMYLLIENASWADILNHNYESRFAPKAFISSLCAWQARYGCTIIFCEKAVTPQIIYNLLFYEIREALLNAEQTDERMD